MGDGEFVGTGLLPVRDLFMSSLQLFILANLAVQFSLHLLRPG